MTASNTKKFILLGILAELIYIALNYLEPLKAIKSPNLAFGSKFFFTILDFYYYLALIALLATALIIYALAFKLIQEKNIKLLPIFIFFLLFNVSLLFIWPVGSMDIITYIQRCRVWTEYHANPYTVAYDNFAGKADFETFNTAWSHRPMTYGPLFTFLGSALTWLGGDTLMSNVFLFKLFFVLLNIACFYLVFLITKKPEIAFLYGWNPLILFEFALNGHNDVIMIFLILLGLYFILNNKNIKYLLLGWLFILLSVFVKYISIILLPIAFLIILFTLKNARDKGLFILGSSVLTVITPLLLYAPFWEGKVTLEPLFAYFGSGSKIFVSIGIFLLSYFLFSLYAKQYFYWAKNLGLGIFSFLYTAIIVKIIKNRRNLKPEHLLKYFVLVIFFYLAFAVDWLMPWYLTLLLALLIIEIGIKDKPRRTYLVYSITLYGILFYILLR